jgi:SOS-response transcriptional repressor LexA
MGAYFSQALANNADLSLWEISTSALVNVGYHPGDILVVDARSVASSGDIVFARLYRWAPQKTELVFRIFEEPYYLVAASSDPGLHKPMVVDHDNTLILGVVVSSVRLRRKAEVRRE